MAGADRSSPRLAALVVTVAVTLAACTAGTPDGGTDPQAAGSTAVPAADQQAVRATIDRLNASSAGAVPAQQQAIAAAVDPALAAALDKCPPATTTLEFQPIYRDLRASPDWTGATGTPAGTVYALPSLIRIFTGDRVTGTDLTTLHLGVRAGEAFLTPLCVG